MKPRDRLAMWTVYDRPRDFPDKFVARKWLAAPGIEATTDVLVADSLDELRRIFAGQGLVCLTRNAADDPCIVETWL